MRLQRKSRKRLAERVETFWLAIRPQKQSQTFWEVTRNKIVEVDNLPAEAWPVLSLDEDDFRWPVERACSNKVARSLIRRNFGLASRVINRSDRGAIYGRAITAMPEDFEMMPASLLMDEMLQSKGWPQESFVAGFLLSVGGGHNEILALWSGNALREMSSVAVTENAQQVEQIIESFCAKHSISSESESNLQVVDLDAVFQALERFGASLIPFPTYDDVYGIPVQTAWSVAAAASLVAAVSAIGAAAALMLHGHVVDTQYAETLDKVAASQQAVITLFNKNVLRVSDRSSVDYRSLVNKAAAAYAPGGVVILVANKSLNRIRYVLPVEPGNANSDALTIQTTPYQNFNVARARKVDGVVPTVSLGASGNELFYDYTIAANNRRLLDYIDR